MKKPRFKRPERHGCDGGLVGSDVAIGQAVATHRIWNLITRASSVFLFQMRF
jgi:hypothetical protein